MKTKKPIKVKKLKKIKEKPIKEKKLDTVFSKWIRTRDGHCLKCNGTENLQCAHIFSRTHRNTRWHELNAITLCYKCHFFWAHKNPMYFAEFVLKHLGTDKYAKLKELFDTEKKFTNDEKKELLKYYSDEK